MDLAENSASDSVKFQASKDLLDRAGFRPIDRREEIRPQRTPAELEAEIKRLVGTEKAELLLGKKSVDDLVQERVEQQEKDSVVNWVTEDNKKDVFCSYSHTLFGKGTSTFSLNSRITKEYGLGVHIGVYQPSQTITLSNKW